MKQVCITRGDLYRHERKIAQVSRATFLELRCLANQSINPLEFLALLKFSPLGRDPLKNTPLNFIEQINQTFTAIASFRAARHIFQTHPERVSELRLNLGTSAGSDIEALNTDGKLVALYEVFASVDPKNNQKLKKDVIKVRKAAAAQEVYIRGVYFISELKKEFCVWGLKDESHVYSIQGELTLSDGTYIKNLGHIG
jgi:hypothetical protein